MYKHYPSGKPHTRDLMNGPSFKKRKSTLAYMYIHIYVHLHIYNILGRANECPASGPSSQPLGTLRRVPTFFWLWHSPLANYTLRIDCGRIFDGTRHTSAFIVGSKLVRFEKYLVLVVRTLHFFSMINQRNQLANYLILDV